MRGRTCRWPVSPPSPALNFTPGTRHTAELGAQKEGEAHVVTFVIWHEPFLYWMVCPLHVYEGVHASESVAVQVPVIPLFVAVPVYVVSCDGVTVTEPEVLDVLEPTVGEMENAAALAEV